MLVNGGVKASKTVLEFGGKAIQAVDKVMGTSKNPNSKKNQPSPVMVYDKII